MPIIIQSKNDKRMPIPSSAPTAMALGADPIIVPIPPIHAPDGIAMNNAFVNGFSLPKVKNKGVVVAIIMAVVAVLLINIDKTAVVSMMPNKIFFVYSQILA